MYLGHTYPEKPTVGLPCPTTIFTFGILLWTAKNIPDIIRIPLIWTVAGYTAALKPGIKEVTGLLIRGILATTLIVKDKIGKRKPGATKS